MPLAFHSLSHGRIAFGFFNIESDMLLLEHYFFFAREFCEEISSLAQRRERGAYETPWRVFDMAEREQIGDLMGAIHGTRFTGFIGDLEGTQIIKDSIEGQVSEAATLGSNLARILLEKGGANLLKNMTSHIE